MRQLTYEQLEKIETQDNIDDIMAVILNKKFHINHTEDGETVFSRVWRRALKAYKDNPSTLEYWLDKCQKLIDNKANANTILVVKNKSYNEPILVKLMMDNNKILFDFLIKAGVDPNYTPPKCSWSNLLGVSKLKHGLYYLEEMVKHGLNVRDNISLEPGKNPVFYAVEEKAIEVARYLIENKSPYVVDKCFQWAILEASQDIADIILMDNLDKIEQLKPYLKSGYIPKVQETMDIFKEKINSIELAQNLEHNLHNKTQTRRAKI